MNDKGKKVMAKGRRKFTRSTGNRPYKKLYVLAVEGDKTEPQYFRMFNGPESVLKIVCLKSQASSPPYLLKRIRAFLKENALKHDDGAWIVVDKDHWTDEQLQTLWKWAQQASNYGLAVSNPKFEYWLLLHFDDGAGVFSASQCDERLRRFLPDYDKGIDCKLFTATTIQKAVENAKRRDTPPCHGWPRNIGSTTVYKLVEHLLTFAKS